MSDGAERRRWPWLVVGGLVLLAVGAASTWAATTVLRPAEDPLDAMNYTFVQVVPGEVGSSLSLNTVAEWPRVPVGVNQAVGVVTSIDIDEGASVSPGLVLYSVGLRPVVAAQGDVPMFRAISPGVTGEDVAQLQRMLATLGHYRFDADGKADAGTIGAIKDWQGALGVAKTGVVEPGDVIFVPRLPTRVTLDPKVIHRGAALAGGEVAVLGLPEAPVFEMAVSEAQAQMIPGGTVVEVTSPDGKTWSGVASEQTRDPDETAVTITITGPDDVTLCGDGCAVIPVTGRTTLPSRIITVARVSGLVVPSSALVTTAGGEVAVVDAAGKRVPVTVQASANGMSVVDGVDAGVRVQVPVENRS